jgi:hypothetical protein
VRPDARRVATGVASRHPADKSACILVLDERQADADMTAAHSWTSEVLRNFVQMHIAMNDLEQQLDRALQPDVKAPHARRFDDHTIIEIA